MLLGGSVQLFLTMHSLSWCPMLIHLYQLIWETRATRRPHNSSSLAQVVNAYTTSFPSSSSNTIFENVFFHTFLKVRKFEQCNSWWHLLQNRMLSTKFLTLNQQTIFGLWQWLMQINEIAMLFLQISKIKNLFLTNKILQLRSSRLLLSVSTNNQELSDLSELSAIVL